MTAAVPRVPEGGPVDATGVPRYAGEGTFAQLPRFSDAPDARTLIWGVPFDSGVSYRPGARFGPNHIRQSSRLLRPYNPAGDIEPFQRHRVADASDIGVNPFHIAETIERGARESTDMGGRLLTLGGDHTIALPLLRVAAARTAQSPSCTSTATSTPGTRISGSPTLMERPSGVPPRKGSSTTPTPCTSGSGGRSTPEWTFRTANDLAARRTTRVNSPGGASTRSLHACVIA